MTQVSLVLLSTGLSPPVNPARRPHGPCVRCAIALTIFWSTYLVVNFRTRSRRLAEAEMPRASWNGFLRLCLVTRPVYLSPASTEVKRVRLNQINPETGNRVAQQF